MVTKRDIIKFLNFSHAESFTTKSIATHFNVTQRTIQNYLKEIKEEYQNCIETTPKGMIIKQPLEIKEDYSIPLTYKERKSYILRKLLMNTSPFDIDELAEYLCISEVTLLNEIKKIRRSIEKYGLVLKTKNNQLFMIGSTKDKNALMIQLIYKEAENSLVSISTLNAIFQNYDAEKIRDVLLEKLNKFHFFMDEYSLINLLLHILITMNHHQQSTPFLHKDDMHQEYINLDYQFISITDEICSSLENIYNVKFTDYDRYQFALLLLTRAIRNNEINHINQNKFSVSNEISLLVNNIIKEIHRTYNIDLNANDFVIAFSLHLKNMLIRIKEKIFIHNPLLDNIKLTSPFIYDIAVYISNIICKTEHVKIYEDEIAYIALHIGVRIEELNSIKGKLKTVLVCPLYYSYYNHQLKKIESFFHETIHIIAIITNPVDLDTISCDFILTTIPIKQVKNCVLISNFFNETDKDNIAFMINKLKKSKEQEKAIILLKDLIEPKLFHLHTTYKSKEDAINKMSDSLKKLGYVQEEYKQKVLDREKISSTDFGMIAIPHPIDYYANKTVIAVSILKTSILWEKSFVKIIFMICINKQDFSNFADIFSFLTQIYSNNSNLDRLVKVKSYDEFMNTMISLYKE